jgi:hypothetical protein
MIAMLIRNAHASVACLGFRMQHIATTFSDTSSLSSIQLCLVHSGAARGAWPEMVQSDMCRYWYSGSCPTLSHEGSSIPARLTSWAVQ